MDTYDYLVIGGGIFGAYTALFLAKKNKKVCLIEKENALFKKASIVNQARLHSGYHYPRSVATALAANDNKERFTEEHKQFIKFNFEKYYAIAKYGSFTDSEQFKRFCQFLNIKAEEVKKHELFNFINIEALFLTEEYSYDPIMIAEYYKQKLKEEDNINVRMNCIVNEAIKNNGSWKVSLIDKTKKRNMWIKACTAINATYSGTNTINRLFGVKKINLVHQVCELAMIYCSKLKNIGFTLMDGHFCSIMPYGLSNLHTLSSVSYTHHITSYEYEPVFECQKINGDCQPSNLSICNTCFARPYSSQYKMISQMKRYLSDNINPDYIFSIYTIKSKLQASYIDDSRPTEISKLNENPDYYCLFAGKINSIYEIEKELIDV